MMAGRSFCVVYVQDGLIWCQFPRKQMSVVELSRVLELLPEHGPCYAALGLDMDGKPRAANLTSDDKPHTLISGTSGSGKSIFQKAVLTSMALWSGVEDVSFVLCDVKGGETFGAFEPEGLRLAHMIAPVLKETADMLAATRWLVGQDG